MIKFYFISMKVKGQPTSQRPRDRPLIAVSALKPACRLNLRPPIEMLRCVLLREPCGQNGIFRRIKLCGALGSDSIRASAEGNLIHHLVDYRTLPTEINSPGMAGALCEKKWFCDKHFQKAIRWV